MLLYPKHSGNLSILKAQDGVLLPEPDKRRLPNRSFHFCREGQRRGMNTQTPSLPSLPLFPAGWTQREPEGWEVKQRDQPPGSSGWRRVKCGSRGRQGITPTPLHLEVTRGSSLLFLLLILKKELHKIELGLLFVHLSIPFSPQSETILWIWCMPFVYIFNLFYLNINKYRIALFWLFEIFIYIFMFFI